MNITIIGKGKMGMQISRLLLEKHINHSLISSTELNKIISPDLVIETTYEDLQTKRNLFKQLDKLPPDVILASNTSSLTIKEISKYCDNKYRILGLHFLNPAYKINMVEIIPASASRDNIKKVIDFVSVLDYHYILCNDTSGFVLNRLLFTMISEAYRLRDEGIKQEYIDKILVMGAKHPIGVFQLVNLIGEDTAKTILKNLNKNYGKRFYDKEKRELD